MDGKMIKNITRKSFERFGIIIENQPTYEDGFFKVLIDEANYGWRIAIYEVTRRSTAVLENHPTSKESFEPLQGTALLIVAENSSPSEYEVFLLDKPVCLYSGVWHQIITLSEFSQVKITENYQVNSEFYQVPNEITPICVC